MDDLIVWGLAGISTYHHIVVRLDQIRFLLRHDWLDGIDWVSHSFIHSLTCGGLTTDSYPITLVPYDQVRTVESTPVMTD